MKKITTLLFILLAMPIYAQWIQQNSGVSETLNDVYCVTEDIVVVVGNAGTILKTTDGGENWVQKNSGTTYDLMKVQFVNQNIGFTVGTNGTLLKTMDGGESWLPIATNFTGSYEFYGLSCVNENIFYIINGTLIKKTIDGGISFTTLNTPPDQGIENIQFLNEQIGYASALGTLLKTIDGGITWFGLTNDYTISSFFFLNENIGFINTIGSGIYKTVDGGVNLLYVGSSIYQSEDLFSLNEDIVWGVYTLVPLCSCPPSFCVTKRNITETDENQEITNCNLDNTSSVQFKAIYFANETNGYITGAVGSIYKNVTGTMEDLGINKVDKNDAVKIYPNPATEKITVSFNETPAQPFAIEITDCLGKKIYSGSFQPENFATINIASFSKGVYFLTIISQQQRQTQKIIVN